jgi:hypothetical protein
MSKVIDRTKHSAVLRVSALSKKVLLGAAAASVLVAAAEAQQFVTPVCGNAALLGQTADPQYAGTVFTSATNTTSAVSTAAGTSLSAADASTAQAMEVVAQRRAQEAYPCPSGFVKSGGVCQPVRRIASAEPTSPSPSTVVDTGATLTSPRKPNSATRSSVDTSDKRRLPVTADDTQFKPKPEVTRNAVWSEAFADYEQRTGLGDATGSARRSQTSAGTLIGVDHAVWSGDTGIVFGLLGGFSRTQQDFQATHNVQANTTFDVTAQTLTNTGEFGTGTSTSPYYFSDPFSTTTGFQYVLPETHTLDTDQKQTLTGPSVGATLSLFRGGFFSDTVAKADFLNLNSTTTGTDTYNSTLSAIFEFPDLPGLTFPPTSSSPDVGCISVPTGKTPATAYSTVGPLTTTPLAAVLSTRTINFIAAENIGYHFDLPRGFWIEPLIGARYNYATYDAYASSLGLENGQALRIQGGARFGLTGLVQDRYIWTNSFTTLLYSDVWISGFVVDPSSLSAAALFADEGRLRTEGILSSKMDLLNGFSTFVQAEARYGYDYWGVGGKAGFRYEW